jgi:dihydrofolate reductase
VPVGSPPAADGAAEEAGGPALTQRRVIVHIAASVDGYIAGPGGDLDWLTSRPAPKGFYGMDAFVKTIDVKLLGRKTYEASLRLGAKFDPKNPTYVFSRGEPPAGFPPGVEFVRGDVAAFLGRLRERPGKDLWLMGGGELIASFLDAGAIDELVVSVVPVILGDGIPLIARRHRPVNLELVRSERFEDGLVQLRYRVGDAKAKSRTPSDARGSAKT